MRHLFKGSLSGCAGMLLDAVFPPRCVLCDRLLPIDCRGGLRDRWRCKDRIDPEQAAVPITVEEFADLLAPYLCDLCHEDIEPINPPICPMCGRMFENRQDADHICGDCIRTPKHFGRARAAGKYSGIMAALIHRFKYEGKRRLAAPLGEMLFRSFRIHWRAQQVDCIIPMPLHKRRLRQRKFNQATGLLRNWRRLSRIYGDVSAAWSIETTVLKRERFTPPQAGLNRRQRLGNIKNAFRVAQFDKIDAKRVLIVDDVYTTGATVNECAKALIKGGAEQVDVLTLARA